MVKNKPKKDGSGGGLRLNRGRGGCEVTEEKGLGQKILKKKLNFFGKVEW